MVDLLLLKKDEDGNVEGRELRDLSDEEAEQLGPLAGDLISMVDQEDIERVARDIPNDCSTGLLLFEHTWAIDLKEAIKNAQDIPVAG